MFNKYYQKYLLRFSAFLLIMVFFSGCRANNLDIKGLADKNSKETFDYEVPVSKPSILVNQLGYYPKSTKTAIFIGDKIPDKFSVVDTNTSEEVFVGEIEHKGYRSDVGMNVSVGTFTGFTKEGEYYLLCDTIGQSYKFTISNTIYDTLLTDLLKEITDNRWQEYNTNTEEICTVSDNVSLEVSGGWYTKITDTEKIRDVKVGCETLTNLLMSAELYMDQHSDSVGIKESGNEIPDIMDEAAYEAFWLLKMQDKKTGFVYSEVRENENGLTIADADIKACQNFIIAMAKFSYTMKRYDNAFATECLRASDAAWKYVETIRASKKEEDKKMQDEIDESLRFFGAAELFRASGAYRYHEVIKEYVPNTQDENKWTKSDYLGIYTYLGSRTSVSKEICEEWMKQIMDLGESVAGESKSNSFLTTASESDDECKILLWKMMMMTCVDYIIGNHEYDTILESGLHYILGRNMNAYSYIEGYGNNKAVLDNDLSVTKDLTSVSQIIFILSEIISNQ